jgi:hypothetical protein
VQGVIMDVTKLSDGKLRSVYYSCMKELSERKKTRRLDDIKKEWNLTNKLIEQYNKLSRGYKCEGFLLIWQAGMEVDVFSLNSSNPNLTEKFISKYRTLPIKVNKLRTELNSKIMKLDSEITSRQDPSHKTPVYDLYAELADYLEDK